MTASLTPTRFSHDASTVLASRLLVATKSELPRNLDRLMGLHADHSGVVAVGRAAAATVTHLRDACRAPVVVYDPAFYEGDIATASEPMILERDDTGALLPAPTLSDFVAGVAPAVDVVLAPSGQVRAGDRAALEAVVHACNGVQSPRLVCTLPVDAEWLTGRSRDVLIEVICSSTHPVALVVVGQFDPFGDIAVFEGLHDVVARAGTSVMLHRTDMIGIQVLAHGALAAAVGTASTLRHTTPAGQFPRRRKRSTEPGLSVFVPGIDSFVDLTTLEDWYVDQPPTCEVVGCDPHALTCFSQRDRPALAGHNAAGVLEVGASLLSTPATHWAAWIADYRDAVKDAFEVLRTTTGRRDISPYGAAKHILKRTV